MPESTSSRPSSRSSSKRKRPPASPPSQPPTPSSSSSTTQVDQQASALTIHNAGMSVNRYLQSFDLPTQLARPSYEFTEIQHISVRPPSKNFIKAHRQAGKPGEPSEQKTVETRYHCRAYLEPPFEPLSVSTSGDGYPGPMPAKRAAIYELAKVMMKQGKIGPDLEPVLKGAKNVRTKLSAARRKKDRATIRVLEQQGFDNGSNEVREQCEQLRARRSAPSGIAWNGAPGMAEYPHLFEPEFWAACPPFSGQPVFGVKLEPVVKDVPAGIPSPRPLLLLTTRPLPFLNNDTPFQVDLSLNNATGSGIVVKAHMEVSKVTSLPTFDGDRIQAIRLFSEKSIRAVVHRDFRLSLDDARWLILPLSGGRDIHSAIASEDIDWESISAAQGPHCSHIDTRDIEKGFEEVLLTEGGEFSKRWAVKGIRHDLKPESPHPSIGGKTIFEACTIGRGHPTLPLDLQDPHQPILEAVTLHAARTHGYIGDLANPSPTVLAVPGIAYRSFLPASVYRTMTLVPHCIHMLDDHLLVHQLNTQLFDCRMSHGMIREALAPPRNCGNVFASPSYDRLEFLGDMVLRLVLTVDMYLAGVRGDRIALERRILESNNALRDCAIKAGITPYIRFKTRLLADWEPRGWSIAEGSAQLAPVRGDMTKQLLGDKLVADVVEALLGAAYLSKGEPLDNVVFSMKRLCIPISMNSWDDVKRLATHVFAQGDQSEDSFMAVFKPKATVLGYTFQNAARAEIALTLDTSSANRPTFEKYKALGHVVIEFIMIVDIWRRFPDIDSGVLTAMRDSRLNERGCSLLALENGVAELLKNVDDISKALIKDFKRGLRRAKDQVAGSARREYWHLAPPCPVLAARMDAILGAIWEDADYSLDPLHEIYQERLRPWHDQHCSGPSGTHYHAKAELFSVISGRCVQWAYKPRPPEEGTQVADIVCHDQVIATGRGPIVEIAHLRASEEALKAIEADPNWLDKWCDCPAKLKAKKTRKFVTPAKSGEADGQVKTDQNPHH